MYTSTIKKYSSAGDLLKTISSISSSIYGMTIDSSGVIWATDQDNGAVSNLP